ncbi:PREDICTED: transcription factor 24 [Colobus angolensis palliatus]|nr:PREDICTED: transcription factor 24 [Colobus angolensis palliatus]
MSYSANCRHCFECVLIMLLESTQISPTKATGPGPAETAADWGGRGPMAFWGDSEQALGRGARFLKKAGIGSCLAASHASRGSTRAKPEKNVQIIKERGPLRGQRGQSARSASPGRSAHDPRAACSGNFLKKYRQREHSGSAPRVAQALRLTCRSRPEPRGARIKVTASVSWKQPSIWASAGRGWSDQCGPSHTGPAPRPSPAARQSGAPLSCSRKEIPPGVKGRGRLVSRGFPRRRRGGAAPPLVRAGLDKVAESRTSADPELSFRNLSSWEAQELRSPAIRPRRREAKRSPARERSRVQTLRHAFLELQRTLPSVPPDTKLSKLDVLLLATTYIAHLTRSLQDDAEAAAADPGLGALRGDGYLHPVKKWPMRSRLYIGATGQFLKHSVSGEKTNNDNTPTDSQP